MNIRNKIIENLKIPNDLEIGFADCAVQQGESQNTYWHEIYREKEIPVGYPFHLLRWKDDYKYLIETKAKFYRYNFFPWAQVQRADGTLNTKRIDLGIEQIMYLREYNIEPILTVWHWDEPKHLKMNWSNGMMANEFANYVKELFTALQKKFREEYSLELKDVIPKVILLNEPTVNAGNSFVMRWWPPKKRNFYLYLRAIHNLRKGYKSGYQELKSIDPGIQISYTKNFADYYMYKKTPALLKPINNALLQAAKYYDRELFRKGLNVFTKPLQIDFAAVNYWHSWEVDIIGRETNGKWYSELDWHLNPEGFGNVLKETAELYPDKEIIITELGVHFATPEDIQKLAYLTQCLGKAIEVKEKHNVNLKGICLWTLIDDIEWDLGKVHSGLINIDTANNAKRVPRGSYDFIKNLISAQYNKDSGE